MPAAKSWVFRWPIIGRRPARLFDVQIAAGLVGYEYPAGYGSLLNKLLGDRRKKGKREPIRAAGR